jgi:hypothetical protein
MLSRIDAGFHCGRTRLLYNDTVVVSGRTARLIGWWYVLIGVGFLLLAAQRALIGGKTWLVALRCVIGILFLILGRVQLRSSSR